MSFLQNRKGVFTSSLFSPFELQHGFGTKLLGDGRRREVTLDLQEGLDSRVVVSPQQVHSTNIQVITTVPTSPFKPIETDGVITLLKEVLLTVITADCVPMIFYDLRQNIVGISHQGWKGTLNKLPKKMIHTMNSLGSAPKDIRVAIGPCINECCYEVGADVGDKFTTAFGKSVILTRGGKIYLNLLKTNYLMLISSGIKPTNIDYFPFCTSCQENTFWSYRRDNGIKGEMLSFVML